MPLRTQFRRIRLLHGLPLARKTFLVTILLLLLTFTAGCRLPDLPTTDGESSLAVEAVEVDADKQAGVAAAAAAAVDETDAESTDAVAEAPAEEAPAEEVVVEAPAAEAPANVDWLTVTNRAEHELPAIGNPDAALTITEFSDFM